VIESLQIDVERLDSKDAITIVRETLRAYREARKAKGRTTHRRKPWA